MMTATDRETLRFLGDVVDEVGVNAVDGSVGGAVGFPEI